MEEQCERRRLMHADHAELEKAEVPRLDHQIEAKN
jgi:hypothetical protein